MTKPLEKITSIDTIGCTVSRLMYCVFPRELIVGYDLCLVGCKEGGCQGNAFYVCVHGLILDFFFSNNTLVSSDKFTPVYIYVKRILVWDH